MKRAIAAAMEGVKKLALAGAQGSAPSMRTLLR
jgi:hypothetical protein